MPNRATWLTAVRTSVTAVIAMLLARSFSPKEFYWAPISAIVVILSTIPPGTLAWQRFVGTALGAVVGAATATLFHPSQIAYAALVYAAAVLACGLLCSLLGIPGAYRFAAITVSIVLLIAHTSPPWIVGLHRFIEVSFGIAVALAMTRVWAMKAPG